MIIVRPFFYPYYHTNKQNSQEQKDQASKLNTSHRTPIKYQPQNHQPTERTTNIKAKVPQQSQQPKKQMRDCWAEMEKKGTCEWKDQCRYNHNISSQKRDGYHPDGKLSKERSHSTGEFFCSSYEI